jgi:hypothetical protein
MPFKCLRDLAHRGPHDTALFSVTSRLSKLFEENFSSFARLAGRHLVGVSQGAEVDGTEGHPFLFEPPGLGAHAAKAVRTLVRDLHPLHMKKGANMPRLKVLFLLTAIFLFATTSVLAADFAVGTCKPKLQSFSTISDAVSTVPAGSTVEVCPGTYAEQVTISQPLTLEGVAIGNSEQVVITPPPGGLTLNASSNGEPLAVQLWVDNAPGPVNISNLIVDGTGNALVCNDGFAIIGIYYQNSPGTVNRVTTRNQKTTSGPIACGLGIWIDGGDSNPTVTIENSSIHDVDTGGINTQFNFIANIKGNYVNVYPGATGIAIGGGTNTVTDNIVETTAPPGTVTCLLASGSSSVPTSGTVSGNTLINCGVAIDAAADGVAFTSNKVFNSEAGIYVFTLVAAMRSNSITNSSIGIEFDCWPDPNVTDNTITDAGTGIDQVPMGLAAPNTYIDVTTIKTNGCP